MSERIKEVSLVDRINDLLSSSILRLHGPNKNHDDCFHCQLIIDLKKIRQALTSTEAELEAEREKVKYYHDKNQEKCAEIDTLRQELADLRGRLEGIKKCKICSAHRGCCERNSIRRAIQAAQKDAKG